MSTVFLVLLIPLFTSCGPPRDILPQWEGVYVHVDDQGPLDWGCEVDVQQQIVSEWRYTADGSVARRDRAIASFDLIDQYSRNYGTRRPTWIYRYQLEDGTAFLLYEFFDGHIDPYFETGEDPYLLQYVPAIPELLRVDSTVFAADLDEIRTLQGRYASVQGSVVAGERVFRAGYGSYSTIFGDSYVDLAELLAEHNDRWTIYPVLRSHVMPEDAAQRIVPFEKGDSVDLLARLVDVRRDTEKGDDALVVVFSYGESFF